MRSRRVFAAGVALSLTLVLGACSGTAEDKNSASASPTASVTTAATVSPTTTVSPTKTPPPVKPSKDLSGITVSGGAIPKIKVPKPWAIDKTTSKVLKAGTSSQVVKEGLIEINYVGVNGRTGEQFDTSYGKSPLTMDVGHFVPGFTKSLVGQKVGSRVLMGIPSKDGYPEGAGDIKPGDTIVFVVDILSAQFSEPQGTKGQTPPGIEVNVGAKGPTVKVSSSAVKPAKLGSYELIKGTGRAVGAKDSVTLRYSGFTWDGKQFVDGWQPAAGTLDDVIKGWQDGIVGKPVGSRLVLVIPPALAYPDGRNTQPTLAPGQTLIYVIDVLHAAAQAQG